MGVVCKACSRHGVIIDAARMTRMALDGMGVICESCSHHGVIDAARM